MDIHVPSFTAKDVVIPASVGAAALAIGLGVGYIFGKRRGAVTIVQTVVQEDPQLHFDFEKGTVIEETPHIYSEDDPEFLALLAEEEAIESAAKARREEIIPMPEEDEDEPIRVNVFHNTNDDWDYESELSTRTKEAPYIIHVDEFMGNELGYDQETMTYYAGDDILADKTDTPLYNFEEILGEFKFGHGTNDPNVVYIRNEKIRMEWEVLLHTGRFEIEVLGHSIEDEYEEKELRHSVQKFRPE